MIKSSSLYGDMDAILIILFKFINVLFYFEIKYRAQKVITAMKLAHRFIIFSWDGRILWKALAPLKI